MRKSDEIYMSLERNQRRTVGYIATGLAKYRLKLGDKISRKLCGGRTGTFTLTHYDGVWLCGVSVSDCHASSIFSVNGCLTDFVDEALFIYGYFSR
jgi:hypothetical protein